MLSPIIRKSIWLLCLVVILHLLIVFNLRVSLNNLVKNLLCDEFKYTSQEFYDQKLDLMKHKGVYPYDYMASFDKFIETQLPNKKIFI